MRIKFLKPVPGKGGKDHLPGDVLVIDDAEAKTLVSYGWAEEAPAPPAPTIDELIAAALNNAFDGGVKLFQQQQKSRGAAANLGPNAAINHSEPAELAGVPVFGSAGGFLNAVRDRAGQNPSRDTFEKMAAWDEVQRKAGALHAPDGLKAPSGNFEGNDPDGGALVIPEFGRTIYERMQLEENFLAQSDSLVIGGNTITLPALDDASRADGSRWGGFLGAWAGEADQMTTVSKFKVRNMDLKLKKLYVFAYMTDELLADSAYSLENYVAKYAAKELVFKTNDSMINGGGGGQLMGLVNAPAKITVTKETGQTFNSTDGTGGLLTRNIDKMWMRLNWQCRMNSVWLINQDCEAALQGMSLPVGIAGSPTYLPPGGVSGAPYATLKGRPVKVVEFCSTLGTEGDVILTDWQFYRTIYKGGVNSAISMHLRFQYDEMAYRFTYRVDGQPTWDKPLTPFKGTTTTSSIVTLGTR